MTSAAEIVSTLIRQNKVMIFSKTYCGYCRAAANLFTSLKVPFKKIELDTMDNGDDIEMHLNSKLNWYTVPMIFINEKFVGGADDIRKLHSKNELLPLINGGN